MIACFMMWDIAIGLWITIITISATLFRPSNSRSWIAYKWRASAYILYRRGRVEILVNRITCIRSKNSTGRHICERIFWSYIDAHK